MVLTAGVMAAGAALLPVMAEGKLAGETKKTYTQAPEDANLISGGANDSVSIESKEQKSGKQITLSAEQVKPYIKSAEKVFVDELNVPLSDKVSLSLQQADDAGNVILSWNGTDSDAIAPEENMYYIAEFENADVDKGTGDVVRAGVSGRVLKEMAQDLREDTEQMFSDEFHVQIPEDVTMYPMLDWNQQGRYMKLQWESFDYDTDEFIVYSSAYEQVSEDCTEGKLCYLSYGTAKMSNLEAAGLSEEQIGTMGASAEEHGKSLGYEIAGVKDYTYFGNTINFRFEASYKDFAQVGIAVDTEGRLKGVSLGEYELQYGADNF